VTVRFTGPCGTCGPGLHPAGTYGIVAYFDGRPEGSPQGTVRVQPGETVAIKCSRMLQACEVVP
jgi:hypothetical protein